jgi:Fe-S-cluster containining protein
MTTKKWYNDGVRFQCQGSGNCCTSRGEYGYVFLTLQDRKNIAKLLKISTLSFTKKYCDKFNGVFHLKEDKKNPDCLFLEGKRCQIYTARPTQCKTWPFWPEVMSPKAWSKEVVSFCPGVGKGPVIKADKIAKILEEQSVWEERLLSGK